MNCPWRVVVAIVKRNCRTRPGRRSSRIIGKFSRKTTSDIVVIVSQTKFIIPKQSKQQITLPVPTPTKTYPLLRKLTGPLVLSVSQEFNDTALIGGKTDNFTGDLADEGSAAGRLALAAADLGLWGLEGGRFLLRVC